jgi:hypothetical protein
MFMLNDQPLPLDTPFTVDDVNYPANWLRVATPEQRADIGITEVADEPCPDDRFYWVVGNGDGTFTAAPKDQADLIATFTDQTNATANSLLAPSDWMVIRQMETGSKAASDWTVYRDSVRVYANEQCALIAATTSVEELQDILNDQQWPLDPDQQAALSNDPNTATKN